MSKLKWHSVYNKAWWAFTKYGSWHIDLIEAHASISDRYYVTLNIAPIGTDGARQEVGSYPTLALAKDRAQRDHQIFLRDFGGSFGGSRSKVRHRHKKAGR